MNENQFLERFFSHIHAVKLNAESLRDISNAAIIMGLEKLSEELHDILGCLINTSRQIENDTIP